MKKEKTYIAIIGGGASGLITAISLARKEYQVLIIEKNNKLGKKILATGNGRCNIGNKNITIDRFHSDNIQFIIDLIKDFKFKEIEDFFNSIGLELVEKDDGKCYPLSMQASSVVNLLTYEVEQLNIKVLYEYKVTTITYSNNTFFLNKHIEAKKLIIATGNLSAQPLGGCDDGLNFATFFKHNIIKSFPSLVQLTSNMPKIKYLSGVKIYSEVSFKNIKIRGDVLFTKYGISGLAILDISSIVLKNLENKKNIILNIDLMPKISLSKLNFLLKKYLLQKRDKNISLSLEGLINKKLIPFILQPLKMEQYKEYEVLEEDIFKISSKIKNFLFYVNGSQGYKNAEVASGGVDTREINSKTLESLKQKNLYFAGEVLDLDGDRGGFNLHLAWSCALKIGKNFNN